MQMELIYLAVGFAALVILLATFLLLKMPPAAELELSKIRLAASMFTGIMLVFIFVSLMDAALGGGRTIFDTGVKGMLPLAYVIAGYFFGAGKNARP
jgi:hypothetical protein